MHAACMPVQTNFFRQLHDLGLLTGNVIVSQLLFLESQHPTKPVRSHCSCRQQSSTQGRHDQSCSVSTGDAVTSWSYADARGLLHCFDLYRRSRCTLTAPEEW